MKSREIKTERLRLAPLDEKDSHALLSMISDGELQRTYMVPDLDTEEKRAAVFARYFALTNSDERFAYGIFLGEELIGMIHEVAKEDGAVEVGYFISSKEKGRGYATEALEASIDELFSLGFSVVKAGAFPENAASLRVMEKSGMRRTEETETVEYRGRTYECVFCAAKKEVCE